MKPKIIKTDEEYATALAHVEKLMEAEPGSSKEAELELWSLLVERYEQQMFPIALPDPIEAIKFRMERRRGFDRRIWPGTFQEKTECPKS
jgi:HTH-type transcriptional regulator/antitoxin HigA